MKSESDLTWYKDNHLLSFSSLLINTLIHPRLLPAHVPQGQNAGPSAILHNLVALATVLTLFQLEKRYIFPLKLPGRLPRAGAGKGERGAPGKDDLFVFGCDFQATQLSAEIQES